MKGKFYGIGVGPGDAELITIKAVNVLKNVDVVAVPESKNDKTSVALDIARPYLKSDSEIITLTFPMIRDEQAKQKIREDNARTIFSYIEKGKSVAFLTLGDPMLYSTYIYLLENLMPLSIDIQTVPGIYSFSAISNTLNMPLVKGDERLAVICSFEPEKLQSLEAFDAVVCMKVSAYKQLLYSYLCDDTCLFRFVMVSNAGHLSEVQTSDIEILKSDIPYFSTAILFKK